MTAKDQTDHPQTTLWNGPAGHAWVEAQELLDSVFAPITERLVDAIPAGTASQVLDVGCGTGAIALAIARRLGADGRCVGVDLSAPMIEAARARAERDGSAATFVHADAQRHPFEPGFDRIVSRFGVMFFDDPVQAFANLRRATTDTAGLRCVAWRDASDNPFMTAAERAAAPLLPMLPVRSTDGPGQFAFADERRVRQLLHASGWTGVEIEPLDVTCTLPEHELMRYVTRLGPVGRALPEVDEATRARVIDVTRAAFEPYVHGADVRFVAACWLITAGCES